MKKFYHYVGEVFLRFLAIACIVAITSSIVITYYEEEKDELFFQAIQIFTEYNEAVEQSLREEYGSIDIQDPEVITNI